jgi:hypothetical protein|tara:strand:- start:25440 stop:25658 length:219 start_codon:yes stop_codon:yes gene_type:complete
MDNNNNVSVKRQKCNNNYDSLKNDNLDINNKIYLTEYTNNNFDKYYMIKMPQDSLNPPLVHRQNANLFVNID